jgi:hypothetical protein
MYNYMHTLGIFGVFLLFWMLSWVVLEGLMNVYIIVCAYLCIYIYVILYIYIYNIYI